MIGAIFRARNLIGCIVVASLWVSLCYAFMVTRHPAELGDDVTQIYMVAVLYAKGEASIIYNVDPPPLDVFNADFSNPATISSTEVLRRQSSALEPRPFTQPPLFAALLAPLASRLSFQAFDRLLLGVNLIAVAGAVLLGIVLWRPGLYAPQRYLGVLALFMLATPFKSAIVFNQVQMLVTFLIMLAIVLDQRAFPRLAGTAAACAITLKITPILLVVAWVVSGRRRAAASALVIVIGVAGLSIVVSGIALNLGYLARLMEISGKVLAATNNQSLRTLVFAVFQPSAFYWINYPLPPAVLWTERMAIVATAFGLLTLMRRLDGVVRERCVIAYCLAAALILPPIVWDHYSIIMPMLLMAVPPAWLGFRESPPHVPRWFRMMWVTIALIVMALECMPIGPFLIWRQLYAATLFAGAMLFSAIVASRLSPSPA